MCWAILTTPVRAQALASRATSRSITAAAAAALLFRLPSRRSSAALRDFWYFREALLAFALPRHRLRTRVAAASRRLLLLTFLIGMCLLFRLVEVLMLLCLRRRFAEAAHLLLIGLVLLRILVFRRRRLADAARLDFRLSLRRRFAEAAHLLFMLLLLFPT